MPHSKFAPESSGAGLGARRSVRAGISMLVCSGLCSIPMRTYIMSRITPISIASPNTRTSTTRLGAIPSFFSFILNTCLGVASFSGDPEKSARYIIVHRKDDHDGEPHDPYGGPDPHDLLLLIKKMHKEGCDQQCLNHCYGKSYRCAPCVQVDQRNSAGQPCEAH